MHLMTDLETLGTRPSAPVIQIGARWFHLASELPAGETSYLGRSICINIAAQDVILRGARVDEDTVRWWRQQSPETIASLTEQPVLSLEAALKALAHFVRSNHPPETVWANGDSFDIGLLNIIHEQCGFEPPWNYNAPRDCRTLYQLAQGMTGWERPRHRVTTHNAERDCTDQVHDTVSAWHALRLAAAG